MTNKFLKLYPKLWVPKIGDQVCVKQVLDGDHKIFQPNKSNIWYYNIGDIGVIHEINSLTYRIHFLRIDEYWSVYHEEVEYYQNDTQ